jgi:PAS domain S-box-containing protein
LGFFSTRLALLPESEKFMKRKAKVLAALAGLVLLFFLGIALLFRAYRQIEQAAVMRQQANTELLATAEFLSSLKDAETGYRGYLLTRDEAFLQPYLMVHDTLDQKLKALRQSNLGLDAWGHLSSVESLMATSRVGMDQSIAQCRSRTLDLAAMQTQLTQGKIWMDLIRSELKVFTRLETDDLAKQADVLQGRLRNLLGTIWAIGILAVALALVFAYLWFREAHQRTQDRFLLETRQLLERQTDLNLALGRVNAALVASEEKLRSIEEGFRLMVESVVDCAIVMLDPDGLVLTWNSGAQRIKGYSAEEILGQPFTRFHGPADLEAGLPQEALANAARTGRSEEQGWRVRKDGSLFYASVILTAIRDQAGELRGFAKLTQDLTERRNVELELREARRIAEEASLAKSEFLSSMSHELRTPLNAILGFAQLMESEQPALRLSQQGSLKEILKAGWHLLTLINEILDLAKVESGRMDISREPVALGEVLAECQSMIGPQAAAHGISMSFPEPGLEIFVLADRTRVKQVLLNLLSNAVKYNVKQGTLEVRYLEPQPGRVRIAVRDTGKGLRPEQLAQLFQPFNRLDQGDGLEGSGIGLVLAKRLVELMGGTIGVASTPGVGSEFWFELFAATDPKAIHEAALGAVDPQPTLAGGQVDLVLYVEDNPANLSLVEAILARHPRFRLLTATDGPAGIALARTEQPKLILMDINLPGMNGFEALHSLRADPATASIPVLAISANAMQGERERGLKAGFADYLTKPIRVDEFMAAVLAAIG